MEGYESPSGLDDGHAWVCDGVRDDKIKTEFFVEFWDGSSYNTYGYWTISNPGSFTGSPYTYYHMNWGWGGSHNDWFYGNNANSGNGNFQYHRENVYVSPY